MRNFEPVLAAAERMAAFDGEWHVVGGWVIDLFLGERTRVDDDGGHREYEFHPLAERFIDR